MVLSSVSPGTSNRHQSSIRLSTTTDTVVPVPTAPLTAIEDGSSDDDDDGHGDDAIVTLKLRMMGEKNDDGQHRAMNMLTTVTQTVIVGVEQVC